MIEFGTTLRLAREAKGYTQAQVAEVTRMAPSTVMDLENENFERIAAPIYGRGFVRLYCEAVGIDPKPLIDEFMAIYNGERDTVIRERKSTASAAKPEPPASVPASMPKPEPEPNPAPEPAIAPEPTVPPVVPNPVGEIEAEPLFAAEPPPQSQPQVEAVSEEPAQVVSRYAAPVRVERTPTIPPSFWRICALLAFAIVLFWGIIVGVRALYRATTSDRPTVAEPADRPDAQSPAAKQDAKASAKPDIPKPPRADIKRESQKIHPLYID